MVDIAVENTPRLATHLLLTLFSGKDMAAGHVKLSHIARKHYTLNCGLVTTAVWSRAVGYVQWTAQTPSEGNAHNSPPAT